MMIIVAAAASVTTLSSGVCIFCEELDSSRDAVNRDKSAWRLSHANEHCSSALVLSLPPDLPSPRIFSCDSNRLCSM